ncbi:glycoside hydrolase family 2 TIM barrel-domain containing protein [Algibacter sp. 2305UL17-15]|uniref:glycoside hydrolase family 2 TIM barrel-domain containing protein n=1 Tax=Algibacter sp. 2305UL17-15 TaxID=3231268 RepID=UPI00345816EB
MGKIGYLIVSFLLIVSCSEQNTLIDKQKFNDGWVFKILQDDKNDVSFSQVNVDTNNWEKVQLPHTPKIEPKIVNDQWQGICWYRKKFRLSDDMKNKTLFLNFEGAMNIAEVWINGEKLMEHHGGYLPFVVDFTDVAIFDKENTIAVRLNNNDNPITGPKPLKVLDFNTYGGIYRNVWLIAKNKLHITDPIHANKTASGGIFVRYPEVSKESAKIHIQTHIKNSNKSEAQFMVRNTLFYKDSLVTSVTSTAHTIKGTGDKEVTANLEVENPDLWSPKSPNLYQLKTEIISNGILMDEAMTTIGIKNVKFIGQDLYLNGEKTFLRGVNRHQEYPYIGYALSDNANYRDAKKIKEAGFDYVRLSHYPQSPSFMRACDELGLVTIDAILGWQYYSDDIKFQKHVFQTAKDLIRRDRNHASVLAWEVSLNESWMPEKFIDTLTKIAHEEYPGDQCFTAGWQSYGYDIYLQARQHRLKHYDSTLKKPYNVSEYGDWEYYAMNAGLNQNSWQNLLQEDRSSRQLRNAGEKRLLQQATNAQEAHNDNLSTPAFADGYWVMYDYNRGYADDLEASGVMDIFRLPKPVYYFYKSQRDADDPFGKPMVHIANNWEKTSPLEVRVFSNCDEIELFLNSKSMGRQKPDNNSISNNLNHPPFTFHLPKFESGTLEAKAYLGDKLVTSDVRQTPEAPAKIIVSKDISGYELEAGSNDLIFVYASVVDENETLVPSFSDKILFKLEGDAELIGENPVNCEAGIASILLKAGKSTDGIKVTASFEKDSIYAQN